METLHLSSSYPYITWNKPEVNGIIKISIIMKEDNNEKYF
jgi:hypothetical protein